MGVIQRQGIKQSLVNYSAVVVAAISTILIYPQDLEVYGIARFVIDVGTFLGPFIMLGAGGVGIKFFPEFIHKEKENRGLLFILLMWIAFGSLLFTGLYFLFRIPVVEYYQNKYPQFEELIPTLIPVILVLGIIVAFFTLMIQYSSNFKRIAIPSVFQSLIKISLPILMLLYLGDWISLSFLIWGIIANFSIALVGMIVYLVSLDVFRISIDFSLFTSSKQKAMINFGLFYLLSSMGSVLAFKIDSIMISSLIDFKSNGIFAIAAFIGTAIAIPTNAIGQISSPIIAESFKRNDLKHIGFLYKEASINLLVIGLFLMICIVCSIEDLFTIMPNNNELLKHGFIIVTLVGISKLIDMATSVNSPIIYYSKYYKFGFISILLMAVFNIFTNLLLIPKFQIVGVAMATLLSLTLYNLSKLIFIWWKFKMQPFSFDTLKLLGIAGIVLAIVYFLPFTEIPLLNIVIRSVIIGLLYVGLVYYTNISSQFNNLLEKGYSKIINRK